LKTFTLLVQGWNLVFWFGHATMDFWWLSICAVIFTLNSSVHIKVHVTVF